MKSYGQYCALAKALDVVGDRWTPLIIRELAVRDARYSDIRDGLPGIATNLLADRLRHLEANGVVERLRSRPPLATSLYRLTEHGQALLPALYALAGWAGPSLMEGRDGDAFRGRWLVVAAEAITVGIGCGELLDVRVRLVTDDEPVDLVIESGIARAELVDPDADGAPPDLTVTAEPETVIAVLAGQRSLTSERRAGRAVVRGSSSAIATLRELGRRVAARYEPATSA